jgi:hypothetical protein
VWENQVDMLNDLWEARAERDRWHSVAEVLARELGKVEYAYAEYENQRG